MFEQVSKIFYFTHDFGLDFTNTLCGFEVIVEVYTEMYESLISC